MGSTLHNYSAIRISGPDSRDFLQGQLTNDVTKLTDNWQFSGYCNPKGRLLALLILWRYGDDFYAVINSDICDETLNRLRMFVLRSKVVVEPMQGMLSAQYNAAAKFGHCTATENHHQLDFSGRSLHLDLANLRSQEKSLSDAEWELANISEGIPEITAGNREMFVPQMVNLDLLGGVSFKKGCYTGQEIVARMHYLGKLKQRMYLCQAMDSSMNNQSACGSKITLAGDSSVTAGHLASNVIAGSMLAVLRIEHIGKRLSMESGDELTVADPQPYDIPQAK